MLFFVNNSLNPLRPAIYIYIYIWQRYFLIILKYLHFKAYIYFRPGVQLIDSFFFIGTQIYMLCELNRKKHCQGKIISFAFGAFETGGQVKKGKIERSPKLVQLELKWQNPST